MGLLHAETDGHLVTQRFKARAQSHSPVNLNEVTTRAGIAPAAVEQRHGENYHAFLARARQPGSNLV
jgi:hypothetical protein